MCYYSFNYQISVESKTRVFTNIVRRQSLCRPRTVSALQQGNEGDLPVMLSEHAIHCQIFPHNATHRSFARRIKAKQATAFSFESRR
jgi:hypothetical protein